MTVADEDEAKREIVTEPLGPSRYDIEMLVAAITDHNRHKPVDMGRAVGNEAW